MNMGMNFMTSPSIHNHCRSPMNIHQALLRPIPERCSDLTSLLDELSLKELQGVFPLILEDIFGYGSHFGWGLKSLIRNYQPREFDVIRSFLSPEGPLFRSVYRLLGDPHTRFEFSVSCLPVSTQNMFEEGTVSPLYSNKVPYHGPSRAINHILLNAFEYFFFHFAYLIVSPAQHKPGFAMADRAEILYSCLLEDYLRYFLPVDSGNILENSASLNSSSASVLSPSSSYISATNPVQSSNTSYLGITYSNPVPSTHTMATPVHPNPSHTLLKKMPTLLKAVPTAGLSPILSSTTSQSSTIENVHLEIWRSEFLVMVLVEFWLNLDSTESRKMAFNLPSSTTVVPSHEHMRMVRIFVKHLHYFSNSCKPAVKLAWNLPPQQTPLDEFKSTVLPRFVQKKLYYFLRLSFERWPLDATFRLPLETWLSYIQPWRYISLFGERLSLTREKDESDKEFDLTWQKFVTENLLFYTVIFQNLIPRFFRMDLTSPTNSYMLFRISKVFSQQHLNTMIEEAERTLQGAAPSWLSSSASRLGAFNPNPSHMPTVAGTLRQHIAELEGSGFVYTPLFSSNVQEKVSDLLRMITDARDAIERTAREQETKKGGWFKELFTSIFLSDGFSSTDDFTADDCKRTALYLQLSADQLCYLLRMNEEDILTENHFNDVSAPSMSHNGANYTVDSHGPHLTPLGRYRLQNNLIKAKVQYHGNPDLQPIRSYELAFLVRLLYHLSSHLNEKYGVELGCLYMRHDWLGRLSRQLLAPPTTCSKLLKDGTMRSARVKEESLPPRVSLRVLAQKQVLGYLMALYFVAYVSGCGPLTFLLFLASAFFLYIVVKTVMSKTNYVSP